MTQNDPNHVQRVEGLGPAERLIATMTNPTDHLVHNSNGILSTDARHNIGVRWVRASHKDIEGEGRVVFRLDRQRNKKGKEVTKRVRVGVVGDDGIIRDGARVVGEYRKAGLYPEVAVWMYQSIADIWKDDPEFVAHWASWAFPREHKDMKVMLAAFLLAQADRVGAAIKDGEDTFYDDDFRAIGEAMLLLHGKGKNGFDTKLVTRVGQVLKIPGIREINAKLGFGNSDKHPHLGRYPKTVERWLRHRELNTKILDGLVRGGQKKMVRGLAASVRYKPTTPMFFDKLDWNQKQSKDGRRSMALGEQMSSGAVDWSGLSEAEVCEKITAERLSSKVVVSRIAHLGGWTRAVMAACIDAGMSNRDIELYSLSLEDLGLLDVPAYRKKWETALAANKSDMRAANLAKNMRKAENVAVMEEAADTTARAVMEEALKGIVIGFVIDISPSQQNAIEESKKFIQKLIPCFPQEKFFASAFHSNPKPLSFPAWNRAAIAKVVGRLTCTGGTRYGEGINGLVQAGMVVPNDHDLVLFIVGDQEDGSRTLERAIQARGLHPTAIVWHQTPSGMGYGGGRMVNDGAVTQASAALGIPLIRMDLLKDAVDAADPYTFLRTLRDLIKSTPVAAARQFAPVAQRPRFTLVEEILKTELIQKPAWAS